MARDGVPTAASSKMRRTTPVVSGSSTNDACFSSLYW
jgi:hypothetical protein